MKKKAKLYISAKSSMQSGRGKNSKWIIDFETKDPYTNTLMGWESSEDTLEEVRLFFSTKEKAINYAKEHNIDFELIEPNKKEFVLKSYAENFIKN